MMPTRFFLIFAFAFALVSTAAAQLRVDEPNPYQWTGSIVRSTPLSPAAGMPFGLKGFTMSHSYEMTMGTFGGQTYNQNYYTNSMALQFNDRMTGQVDVAVAHSPFGNGLMMNQGPRVFIRNAEFQYRISPKTQLSVSYQQNPWAPYRNPAYYGY